MQELSEKAGWNFRLRPKDNHFAAVLDLPPMTKRAFLRSRWERDGLALLALIITFSLRYFRFFTSHLLFGPFLDNVHVYGPIFSEASRLALTGNVPYYLPDIGTGFPIFESPHLSILYPFYFFGLINYGGPLASLYTLTNLTLLHVFIFYFNLYVLLRCATVSPWASYIGASVGMLARNTELYASWITWTSSYAWLPLMLAGVILLLRYPEKPSGVVLFSVSAGLLTLASPSQSVIHASLMCVVVFTVAIAWFWQQRRFSEIWFIVRSLVLCAGIAFSIGGVAVLPMYIATGEMIRHVGAGATVIGHGHIPWKSFNLYQLSLSQAAGIIIRPTLVSIVGSPYVGPLGIIGALLTGIYFRRLDSFLRMLVVAFGIIGVYGLLSGFGTNLGLAYVNFHLPGFNVIREAGRHFVLFVVSVSFLSGIGYGLLARDIKRYKKNHNRRQLIVPVVLMAAFLAVIGWELFHPKLTEREHFLQSPASFWMLALAPSLFLLGHLCKASHYKEIASAAILVSMAAIVIPLRGFSVSQSAFNGPINVLSHRVLHSVLGQIDATNYRVDFRDSTFPNSFWAMNASYYGIKSFYNQLTPQPYAQARFMNMAGVPHFREMMGARYVLCGLNNSPINQEAKQILEAEGYRLYENPNPMGRLTLVHRVVGFTKNEARLKIMSQAFDYFSEAYVTPHDFQSVRRFLGDSQTLPHARDRITKIADRANRSYSVVESDSPALLILNEWFTPAWKARVNAKRRPVLRVNEWQTGVLLPAGKNRVEFEYRPTLFRALAALNRITLVLLLLFVIFAGMRKASKSSRHSTMIL